MYDAARRWLPAAGIAGLALIVATSAWANVLTQVQRLDDIGGDFFGTTALAVAPDGKHLYSADDDGGVELFIRNPVDGTLTFVARYTYPTTDPNPSVDCDDYAHVTVSPDGKNVYATCYDPQRSTDAFALMSYTRDPGTGALTPLQAFPDSGVSGLSSSFDVTVSHDGTRVYVAGHDGRMATFSRDTATGLLTLLAAPAEPHDARLAGVVVSPDDAYVYGSTEFVYLDAYSVTPGGLGLVASYEEGVSGFEGIDGGVQLAMSPDGSRLYVSACQDGTVGVFARDGGTGTLSFLQSADLGVGGTGVHEGVAITPDGRYVFATNKNGPIIAVFARNLDGTLNRVESDVEPHGEGWLAVDPDGHHLYLASYQGTITVYRIAGCGMPLAGCRHPTLPAKSTLTVKDLADDTKDVLVWNWTKGAATTFAEFGTPLADTEYAMCVWDRSGPSGAPNLLSNAVAPAAALCRGLPCWKKATKKGVDIGWNWNDTTRSHDGVNKITLRQGLAGAAKVSAKGGGLLFQTPAPPYTGTVTMQLQQADGVCWEASFSTPLLNQAGSYRAKSD